MRPVPRAVRPSLRAAVPVLLVALAAGCSESPVGGSSGGNGSGGDLDCNLDLSFLVDPGVGRDGIPAITDPEWVEPNDPVVDEYLRSWDRVVGFLVDGVPYAVPHNILWYHEIANLNFGEGSTELAVTYCPLTGSALTFDRASVSGAEFGVSGLLYKSNLVMHDRASGSSLWPQMLQEARCGPSEGEVIERYPSVEMTWEGWLSLHPGSRVVGETEWDFSYGSYPYTSYEDDEEFWYPMPEPDGRRFPKERVLGIPGTEGALVAFPFGELDREEGWAAVPFQLPASGRAAVVLWDGERRAAMAYVAELEGEPLAFRATTEGIFDEGTGSRWSVEGRVVSGPLSGAVLEPITDAYVAFWGAWAAFFPDTELWEAGATSGVGRDG